MNKKDLVESLAKIMPVKKDAHAAVERIFTDMKKALRAGDKVVVSEFGSFHVVIAKAKKGRNPNTGETLQIQPRKKIRFRQGKAFF